MKRKLISLAAAIALLVPLGMARPQPASASCGLWLDIITFGITAATNACAPFGAADLCSITQVGASASNGGNGHSYDYVMVDPCGNVHVRAGFDVTTNEGSERLEGNGRTIRVLWSCTSDPWIAPPNSIPTCIRLSASLTGNTSGIDVGELDASYPLSAAAISDISHRALNGQLQNAIKQAQQPPAPAPAPAPAPTQPDFQLVAVRAVQPRVDPATNQELPLDEGLTALYDIVVTNLGSKPQSPVKLSIQVTGSVEYVLMAQTPDGWNCDGTAPILCTGSLGGNGDPVQDLAAIFRVQVRGTKAGVGAITASVDPDGAIQESDETNNSGQVVITVQ